MYSSVNSSAPATAVGPGPIDRPPTAQATPQATPHAALHATLLARLGDGRARAALTFAGQGVEVLPQLTAHLDRRPDGRAMLAQATERLQELAASPFGEASGRFRFGFDLLDWVDSPDTAPPAGYLQSCAVSYPLVFVAQALAWDELCAAGFAAVVEAGGVVAVTGHSQGLLAALAVAEDPSRPLGERLDRYVELAFRQGVHQAAATAQTSPTGDGPMVAIGGVRRARLETLLDDVNRTVGARHAAVIALVNGPDRLVVSGPPATLTVLRSRLDEAAAAEAEAHRAGRHGGAPLQHRWDPLPVDVPFHSPALADAQARHRGWLAAARLLPTPDRLALPVLASSDGADLRHETDLADAVARDQFVAPVRWDRSVAQLVERGADWILDLGPGTDVARLTGRNLRGRGTRVLPLVTPEGLRILTTPGAAPAGPDVRYQAFAPGLVDVTRRHLDNRYTRATGQPPIVLPGMTPTTADVAIVAAAANSGYTAELAGGGQPAPWIFTERMAELREAVAPGAGCVFNALYLDRTLWDLHIDQGLLFEAKRAGAPLVGLTVSAGVPEVDEAVRLLDRLVAEGFVHNAFKPGTVRQVRQVLAIADAARHHTVFVHIEGGKAGGHHSFEDLDELLLATYHELRLRPNVVLCVGGGIGTPERAADLLTGAWAVSHGEPAMPVDAVLVGTVAMACAEATASPQVKAALAAVPGTTAWIRRRGRTAGVYSGRSNLGADIHVLDNTAARVADLLLEVAGDEAAVAARRDEIVAALAATARPYFGDLAAMTGLAVLARFTELCAIGRHGRYEDGAWGDPTWRARAHDLYRRLARRLGSTPPASLDDPQAALDSFADRCPAAATALMHPADVLGFLEICDGPGKPVPFVPVLDGEIRRWYMADALWPAQDDRHAADAVLVIPGPEAVTGIRRSDEPVAELLGRFERAVIDRLTATGTAPTRRDRLADTGLAPAPLGALAGGRSGPLAALCVTAEVSGRRNPLWTLLRPTDDVAATVDESGCLQALEARPVGAVDGERVTAELVGDEIVITAAIPGLDQSQDLVLRVAPPAGGAAPFREIDGAAARASFHRSALVDVERAGPLEPGSSGRGWRCRAGMVAAYRAAVGAAHDGVPLDLAFSLAWPALIQLLVDDDLAPHLAQLVHREHRVEPGPAWPPRSSESGRVTAEVVARGPEPGGHAVRVAAELVSPRGVVARVEAGLLVRATVPGGTELLRQHHDVEIDLASAAEHEVLVAHEAYVARPGCAVAVGDRLRLDVVVTSEARDRNRDLASDRGGRRRYGARGRVLRDGSVVANLHLERLGDEAMHPVQALIEVLGPVARPGGGRAGSGELARTEDTVPESMRAFARIGRDHNPLHRSVLAARLAGLEAPIAHGLWTAARAGAFMVDEVCGGDRSRLRDWSVDFVAPVPLGAGVELVADEVALDAGLQRISVVVRTVGDERIVASARALVAPPATALVFPGQGVQRRGLGADGRSRSRAARAVWERADRHVRTTLGFSLLDVVERNPGELRLPSGAVVRHPRGVLHRTELAQLALVALAAAQLAERRADGVLPDDLAATNHVVAGHSLGEFSALLALDVLPLEVALDLVYRRGRAMQAVVRRDSSGASPYRLAAVDPAVGRVEPAGLAALVAQVALHCGELAEVVNQNAPGRQYVVAGTETSLAELRERLGAAAVRILDGIDVPFHSSVLWPAVSEFREHLDELVPPVDHTRLVGRWVPNLVGQPFSLDDRFVAAVAARSVAARELLGRNGHGPGSPDELARRLVVELLAQQLASPVRWIDVQRSLTAPPVAGGLGVRRQVEIGPAESPVLTNLAGLEPAEPSVPAPVFAAITAKTGASSVEVGAGWAVRLLLAVQARVQPGQLRDDETLDELFQGVSSRRNQVLIDLGREFGLSGTEGVHEASLAELTQRIADATPGYRFPGPYLADTIAAGLSRLGLSRTDALAALPVPADLADAALATLVLETRPGDSARGGPLGGLAGLTGPALGDEVATRLGLQPVEVRAESNGHDTAAAARLEAALVGAARQLMTALDHAVTPGGVPLHPEEPSAPVDLERELGRGGLAALAGRFDPRRRVRFGSVWAAARWDLVALYHDARAGRRPADELRSEADRLARHAGDRTLAGMAYWLADRARADDRDDVATLLGRISAGRPASRDFDGEIALVTGASPGSIAAELVRRLLQGGATVVVVTSTETPERRRWYRDLYRRSAAPGAELHVVPANLASLTDVDALVDWLADGPLLPTLLVPFAAAPAVGDAGDADGAAQTALRIQLLGVERLVTGVARAVGRRGRPDPVSVLVPLSPNHGDLGGDGLYGESKAALEVLVRRGRSEYDSWGRHASLVAAWIGWVRGTGLMAGNDVVAARVEERLGIRTFSTEEMGELLASALASPPRPARVDLTGGLGDVAGLREQLVGLRAEVLDEAATERRRTELTEAMQQRLWPATEVTEAEPAPETRARAAESGKHRAGAGPRETGARTPEIDPAEMVVIVGAGELGPCGTALSRFALELDEPLPDAVVLELAWLCGLVRFERQGYRGRWVDSETGDTVAETDLADRYRTAVQDRVGLRPLEDDGVVDPDGLEVQTAIQADADISFEVASEAQARDFVAADPARTEAHRDPHSGVWWVTRKAGTPLRAARRSPHRQPQVAGQFPRGLDLRRFGIPGDLATSADRLALVNLACTAEAFRHAGLEPEELLAAVHPALVANTQGAGMGGMASLRRLVLDQALDGERQPDRLQESLGNVVAAHVVQSYVGSYGPMVHPVAACATAAVSLEEACDKIRSGKALAVVAGGFDDLTPEGMVGFGDMRATADSDELVARGLTPAESSRPNDERRQGFVESQGGGSFLVVRGDVALDLGLPVRGVLVYAGSFADGIHTSIPAPGLGLLAAACGGTSSPLASALRRHGLSADDIAVVSKHDTSTELNDPNEADLHQRLQQALGRTPGNPLLVVSQKARTGHAKGGAAAWQVAGVLQMLESGRVPGNRNLDTVDPALRAHDHLVHGDRTIELAGDEPLRAALVSSLGFGHVSALLALAHPDTFVAAVPAERRADYLARAEQRRARGEQALAAVRLGMAPPLRRTDPIPGREAEAALLLDPDARIWS